jgi:hypothetical protein
MKHAHRAVIIFVAFPNEFRVLSEKSIYAANAAQGAHQCQR